MPGWRRHTVSRGKYQQELRWNAPCLKVETNLAEKSPQKGLMGSSSNGAPIHLFRKNLRPSDYVNNWALQTIWSEPIRKPPAPMSTPEAGW